MLRKAFDKVRRNTYQSISLEQKSPDKPGIFVHGAGERIIRLRAGSPLRGPLCGSERLRVPSNPPF